MNLFTYPRFLLDWGWLMQKLHLVQDHQKVQSSVQSIWSMDFGILKGLMQHSLIWVHMTHDAIHVHDTLRSKTSSTRGCWSWWERWWKVRDVILSAGRSRKMNHTVWIKMSHSHWIHVCDHCPRITGSWGWYRHLWNVDCVKDWRWISPLRKGPSQ